MTEERRRDEHADNALVEAAWRNASRDEPPARLDTAILAAASAETRRPAPGHGIAARRAWWTRWQPLAAAAAVAGLAFVLVQTIPREEPLPSPAESTATPAGDAAPATLPPPRTPVPATTPAATESVPEPPPTPTQQADRTREVAPSPAARPAGSDALAGVAPQAAARAEAAASTPDAWARRIAALHGAGDLAAAAAELHEFRRAFPDADQFLPDDLRGWAAGVPAPDAP